MRKTFRISVCLSQLRAAMAAFPDCRTGRNCQYSIETLGMTAFTTFFLQSPSFRSHHTLLRQLTPRGNAARLFHLPQIPCSNQVRRVLDAVDPRYLVSVYDSLFQRLDRQGLLQTMRGFKRDVLIPLDGTPYFSSKTIQCPQCSTTTHHDGSVTYSHTALLPAIVMPGAPFVLPLAPEFIRPQDGHAKQDCEPMAAKRWIAEFRRRHKRIGVTVLGDDLYATRPMCDTVLAHRCNFIFVCKPGSHPTLSARIAALQRTNRLSSKTVRCVRGGTVGTRSLSRGYQCARVCRGRGGASHLGRPHHDR